MLLLMAAIAIDTPVFVSVVSASGLVLAAFITGAFQLIRKKMETVAIKLDDLHVQINSRLTELINATKQASELKGARAERDKAVAEIHALAAIAAALAKPTTPVTLDSPYSEVVAHARALIIAKDTDAATAVIAHQADLEADYYKSYKVPIAETEL